MNLHFDPFVIPFTIGWLYLFGVIIYKFSTWIIRLTPTEKAVIKSSIFTKKSIAATWEVIRESLFHINIFRRNFLLGYMHMSLAFGWFLLIVVGKFETSAYLKDAINLPHVDVFFRFFFPEEPYKYVRNFNYAFLMDLILLFVLSGVALAWFKRIRSSALGVKKATKHTLSDRIALSSLWLVFPMRLLAESATCGIYDTGSFLTNKTGHLLASILPENILVGINYPLWWIYSIVLGLFFIALPGSRYMHIFTEIPLIYLRKWGVKQGNELTSYSNFEIESCSRCGLCIDDCQLQSSACKNNVQSVYFLRDLRYGKLTDQVADNCLMCGRCALACPVGINLDDLRLASRRKSDRNLPEIDGRYKYIENLATDKTESKVGYFAGCMTLLTPKIIRAIENIASKTNENIWWADKDGGICCGRPQKLSGDLEGAKKLTDANVKLFKESGITTLVTGCPICMRTFIEDYKLEGIEILHHSQYIKRLIDQGKLKINRTDNQYVYHDPCELGRGLGIYDEPREVLNWAGNLVEPSQTREHSLCCGGSVANLELSFSDVNKIAGDVVRSLSATGAEQIASACPQCKKSLSAPDRNTVIKDISEIISENI